MGENHSDSEEAIDVEQQESSVLEAVRDMLVLRRPPILLRTILTLGLETLTPDSKQLPLQLFRIFLACASSPVMVSELAFVEVRNTHGPNTILRENTMATRLMSLCCQHDPERFFRSVLQPHVRKILAAPHTYTMETDPKKRRSGKLKSAQRAITSLVRDMLSDLFSRASQAPVLLRMLAHDLRVACLALMPEAEWRAMTSLLFLRTLGKAVIEPVSYGVTGWCAQPSCF